MNTNPVKMSVGFYGTPGFPGEGDMLTRQAAEHFAEQLKGKIIDNPAFPGSARKLMIDSVALEGNERQGQIMAACIEVQDSVTVSDTL